MGTESLVWYLILLAVFGLIVGAVARLLVPGPTPLGLLGTMAAGLAGAFIAGVVARLLLGPDISQGVGWVLSILGAAVVVALVSGYGRTSYRRPRAGCWPAGPTTIGWSWTTLGTGPPAATGSSKSLLGRRALRRASAGGQGPGQAVGGRRVVGQHQLHPVSPRAHDAP